ncbi:hypothetical protein BVY02_00480 [bacterium J17]|nr:hypothetical protein BVY02_00480 [bacterium J17]
MSEENSQEEQNADFSLEEAETEDESRSSAASRARNKTVMLSPEIAGQVRARISGDEGSTSDPFSQLLPPMGESAPNGPSAAEKPKTMSSGVHTEKSDEWGQRVGASLAEPSSPPAQPPLLRPEPAPTAAAPVEQPSFSVNKAPTPRATQKPRTSKIIGFMVSFDKEENGEVFEICAGRWLLTSRPTDHGEFILINDETISPLHAIIRATSEGKVQVLDQLSEFGTGVTKQGEDEEVEVAGSMISVEHGDIVRFGKRSFTIVMVPVVATEE